MSALPVINLQAIANPEVLGEHLMAVGKSPGFFYVEGHGISEELQERMFEMSREFFQETSLEDKLQYLSRSGEPGYSPIRREKLSGTGSGDLKESFHFRSFTTEEAPVLPHRLQKYKADLEAFSTQCEKVGKALLNGFAIGLGLPFDFLDKHHTGEQNRFRILHYPQVSSSLLQPKQESSGEPLDIRAGAHSDYGSLTLLFQQAADKGGLQVREDNDWKDVPALKNAIVVNIGDALEFWTAGRLRSTVHRVTFPQSDVQAGDRYSIPFFIQPNDDAKLSPMLSTEVLHLENKAMETSRAVFREILMRKGYPFDADTSITAYTHRTARENVFQSVPV